MIRMMPSSRKSDSSIRKNCHKLQDVNVYLIQFQNFTQDLMMLMGNLMKFKLRLPSFMKNSLYKLTAKTVEDIFTKNDFSGCQCAENRASVTPVQQALGIQPAMGNRLYLPGIDACQKRATSIR